MDGCWLTVATGVWDGVLGELLMRGWCFGAISGSPVEIGDGWDVADWVRRDCTVVAKDVIVPCISWSFSQIWVICVAIDDTCVSSVCCFGDNASSAAWVF